MRGLGSQGRVQRFVASEFARSPGAGKAWGPEAAVPPSASGDPREEGIRSALLAPGRTGVGLLRTACFSLLSLGRETPSPQIL